MRRRRRRRARAPGSASGNWGRVFPTGSPIQIHRHQDDGGRRRDPDPADRPATPSWCCSARRPWPSRSRRWPAQAGGEAPGRSTTKLPVVFGTGSVLSFLEANPVDRITVIYKPLMWNVSERIVLIESQGKQYAYYPSDMETKIFADKAVTAPWGGKLGFVPRAELDDASSIEMLERLDKRFAGARPQSEKDGWKAGVSGVLSAALTAGPAGLPGVPAQGPVQVAQVPRAGAGARQHRRPGRHGRHQGRGARRSRTSTSAARSTRSTASTSRST